MKALRILCVGLALVVVVGCVHRASTRQPAGWRAEQEVWWTRSGLVKDAIVSYLRFLDEHPEVDEASSPYWEIVSLILLLDGEHDTATLEALADLTSYYIGESGAEVMHCIILRTGSKLTPMLEERLSSGRNDCHAVLGASSTRCLAGDDYRAFLEGTLKAIKRDESCYIER
jgi:hypothetical protein